MEGVVLIATFVTGIVIGFIGGHNIMWNRAKDDMATVANIARLFGKLDRGVRMTGPGMQHTIRVPIERKGVEFEMVLTATQRRTPHQ